MTTDFGEHFGCGTEAPFLEVASDVSCCMEVSCAGVGGGDGRVTVMVSGSHAL